MSGDGTAYRIRRSYIHELQQHHWAAVFEAHAVLAMVTCLQVVL